MTEPEASRTASLTRFSEAMSSSLYSCRSVSSLMDSYISGSKFFNSDICAASVY